MRLDPPLPTTTRAAGRAAVAAGAGARAERRRGIFPTVAGALGLQPRHYPLHRPIVLPV